MRFTDEDLREFIKIYEKEFEETLSMGDAEHMASQLMELAAILIKPLPSEQKSAGKKDAPPAP